MTPEQHATAVLRRELRRLEAFREEVATLAATNPRDYVCGWGPAKWCVILIEREIARTERQIARLSERASAP
jgi:hypothetical protein